MTEHPHHISNLSTIAVILPSLWILSKLFFFAPWLSSLGIICKHFPHFLSPTLSKFPSLINFCWNKSPMIFELSSVVRILISSGNFIFLELFGVSTHLSHYVSSYVLTAHQSPFFFFFLCRIVDQYSFLKSFLIRVFWLNSFISMLKIFNVYLWSSASYWIILLPFVVLEKTLESPLDIKEIKPVNPKENQPWIFIGRTDAEAEAPVLWPPDVKNWMELFNGKDPDAGKDWGLEKKEGGNRRWDGWMASQTQWTWMWVNSGRQWRTGKPGVLQLQRVHWTWLSDWTTNSCLLEVSAWTCEVVR